MPPPRRAPKASGDLGGKGRVRRHLGGGRPGAVRRLECLGPGALRREAWRDRHAQGLES